MAVALPGRAVDAAGDVAAVEVGAGRRVRQRRRVAVAGHRRHGV